MNNNSNNHTKYLAFTLMSKNTTGIIPELTGTIRDCNCNIVETRVVVMGNELSSCMLLAGSWDGIAKIEDALIRLKQVRDFEILFRRTELPELNENTMPYSIDIITYDQSGIINKLANFFNENRLHIMEINSNTFKTVYTGTTMLSIHMIINIPVGISIADIRGEFMDFCDQLNLDAMMEPVK